LYDQERNAYNTYGLNVDHSHPVGYSNFVGHPILLHHTNLDIIRASRAVAERIYLNCLTRYMRNAKRWTGSQTVELQKHFTREKMHGLGPLYRDYLLGMFPPELL
jgi:hypothetical protein